MALVITQCATGGQLLMKRISYRNSNPYESCDGANAERGGGGIRNNHHLNVLKWHRESIGNCVRPINQDCLII